jgi:hypothetical protein
MRCTLKLWLYYWSVVSTLIHHCTVPHLNNTLECTAPEQYRPPPLPLRRATCAMRRIASASIRWEAVSYPLGPPRPRAAAAAAAAAAEQARPLARLVVGDVGAGGVREACEKN